jgi:hypothetical protein
MKQIFVLMIDKKIEILEGKELNRRFNFIKIMFITDFYEI